MHIRDEVNAVIALGRLPSSDADSASTDKWGKLLSNLKKPLNENESLALCSSLPILDDDCYGLAWSILHAIESCPVWSNKILSKAKISGPWKDRLENRLRNK